MGRFKFGLGKVWVKLDLGQVRFGLGEVWVG